MRPPPFSPPCSPHTQYHFWLQQAQAQAWLPSSLPWPQVCLPSPHTLLPPSLPGTLPWPQVRTLVQQEMGSALLQYDALLLPAAPSVAYKLGDKSTDPLAMYKGDLMTINVNLAGLPAIVLPASYSQVRCGGRGGASLPPSLPVSVPGSSVTTRSEQV